jgi:small GTP-binding protein
MVVFGGYAGQTYKLQLWDTAGQEKYRSLVPAYLKDAHCGVLVFETARKESFDNVANWLALMRDHAPAQIIIILVAHKSDLMKLKECSYAESVSKFAQDEKIQLV